MSDEWYVKIVYSKERKLKERRKRVDIEYRVKRNKFTREKADNKNLL